MRTRVRYAAGLAAAVVLVSACSSGGGEDPPSSTTATSSGSSSSATTTTTPPTTTTATVTIPAAAKEHTAKGAEAFVKFFVDQTNRASTSADTTIIPAISDPGCLSCQELQKVIVRLHGAEQRYQSPPSTIRQIVAIDGGPEGQQFVRLRMVQNEVNIVDAGGRVVSTEPRADVARTASVTWRGESWVMFGIA